VHVRIDQTGTHVLAPQVDRIARLVVTEPGDPALEDGDVGIVNFAGADVDEARILQERVRRGVRSRIGPCSLFRV
jgi:hypothetical protein